jgi:hypothetical protein
LPVEQFPGGIEVTGMPGSFLDHVEDDPPEIGDLVFHLGVVLCRGGELSGLDARPAFDCWHWSR